jgi:hypothetical protein
MIRTLVLVCFALVAARAHAQPAAAQAEVMFRKGKQLLAEGKTAEACAAFDASQKLDPTVSTLLNQANCREKNGQLATAWGLFLEAERQTRGGGDENKQLHQVATAKAAKVEARMSTLTINADSKLAGLEVRRDTTVIDPLTYNQALPIDGGTYKITAKAPGKVEWSTTIKIENEKDAKTVTVKLEEPKKAVVAPPPAPPPPAPPPVAPTKDAAASPSWFCTEARDSRAGTCKPKRDQCETSRNALKAQFADLTPCYGATTASCFRTGRDLHCAPTGDICDVLRSAASGHGAKVTPCRSMHDINEPDPPPEKPAPPKPNASRWSCTESKARSTIGVCKAERSQCETTRSAMLARTPDLSPCHDLDIAVCFDLDGQPRCGPTAEICDAIRDAARKEDRPGRIGSCTRTSR